MKTGPRPVLVIHSSLRLRDQVRRLAGREFSCHFVPAWPDLVTAVRQAPPSAIAVVDPYAGAERGGVSRALRSLVAEFPSLPVFAAVDSDAAMGERVVTLEDAGIAGVIAIGLDDAPAALRPRFRRVEGRFMKLLLARVLPPAKTGRAEELLAVAAEVVAVGGFGRDMARTLSTSRRSLLRWMYQSELLCPQQMLAWMRLLQAAELLQDPERSGLSVATACGYSSDSGLRRAASKLMGKSPTELRRRDAFAEASRAFLAALESPRAQQQCQRWGASHGRRRGRRSRTRGGGGGRVGGGGHCGSPQLMLRIHPITS
jgi:AraC-like DNA-binding protein